LAAIANAQILASTFAVRKATTLAGTEEAVTCQKPAGTTSRNTQFLSATLYCSADCTVELETDGAEATGTALTPVVLRAGAPVIECFHTSDVGDGDTIRTYHLTAGQEVSIGLSSVFWAGAAGLRNLTLRTNQITGDVELSFLWSETNP
jgi:hypothetical protein